MAVKMQTFQTRDEWLRNRSDGIGGSEISAVVGLNPYVSNTELWEIKTGRMKREDISDKPYVQYGTQAEMHLRGLFRLDFPLYQVEYIDNNSWTNDKYPWAKASLDGWMIDQNGRLGVLEIKTSEILSSQHKEKWAGNKVPSNYYCQALLYMAVIEADFAIIKAQLKTEFDGMPYLQTKHYLIEREDAQEDIDYLMSEGEKFWGYVQRDEAPPLILPEII